MRINNRILILFILGVFTLIIGCSKDKKVSKELKEMFTQGKYFYLKGELKPALKVFSEVIAEAPSFLNARIMKIKTLYYLRDFEKAYQEIILCEEIFEGTPTISFWKAKVLQAAGKTDRSISIFKDLLSEDPYNFRAHYELAKLYRDIKKYKEALISYREALSIESVLPNIRMDIIEIYHDLKFYDQAKEMLSLLDKSYLDVMTNKKTRERFNNLRKKMIASKK